MVDREDSRREACKEFEQGLVLYYYGECAEAERGWVETHLEGCRSCRNFLEDVRKLLPLTVEPDEPPPAFWEEYSREVRRRLAAGEQKSHWWKNLPSFFHPWPVPALATALVLLLALTLTFTKRAWRVSDFPPEEEALLEILPMAENMEFFEAMELLDAMDLLETAGGLGNGSA